jgi:hypothetical protein
VDIAHIDKGHAFGRSLPYSLVAARIGYGQKRKQVQTTCMYRQGPTFYMHAGSFFFWGGGAHAASFYHKCSAQKQPERKQTN